MRRVGIIDSHTGGEPTRLVLAGGPDLGVGPLSERVTRFREHFDAWRSAIVNEPRGSDPVVGALLVEPHRRDCRFGLVASLAHLGRITPGMVPLDTPVGAVEAELHSGGGVSVTNVASYRKAKGVAVQVPGLGEVRGDVAWGGNWFFLVEDHGQTLDLAHVEALTESTWRIRQAVNAQGFPEVDHVELFAPSAASGVNRRNFVLCPGKAYDRSPCGTGTSAKLACLAADGKLAEGADWVQESVIGSRFTGRYRWLDRAKGEIAPVITGTAFVTAEGTQVLDPRDPFCWGIG